MYKEGKLLEHPEGKIVTLEQVRQERINWTNLCVVLTCGSYDLQHAEHYRYIATGKMLGAIHQLATWENTLMLVGLDSNQHIKGRKGESRPILDFIPRALQLAWLNFVDYIFEHNGDDLEMIRAVRPDIFLQSLATTQESLEQKQPQFDLVEAQGGINVVTKAENQYGVSTSNIIKRAKE